MIGPTLKDWRFWLFPAAMLTIMFGGAFSDYGLTMLAIGLAAITPKGSIYRSVNYLLAAEFAFSAGMVDMMHYLQVPDESPAYFALAGKDAVFALLFGLCGGVILRRLSYSLAIYNLAVGLTIPGSQLLYNWYEWVAPAFCVAQLLCAIRGPLDEIAHCNSIDDIRRVIGSRRSTR